MTQVQGLIDASFYLRVEMFCRDIKERERYIVVSGSYMLST